MKRYISQSSYFATTKNVIKSPKLSFPLFKPENPFLPEPLNIHLMLFEGLLMIILLWPSLGSQGRILEVMVPLKNPYYSLLRRGQKPITNLSGTDSLPGQDKDGPQERGHNTQDCNFCGDWAWSNVETRSKIPSRWNSCSKKGGIQWPIAGAYSRREAAAVRKERLTRWSGLP